MGNQHINDELVILWILNIRVLLLLLLLLLGCRGALEA